LAGIILSLRAQKRNPRGYVPNVRLH